MGLQMAYTHRKIDPVSPSWTSVKWSSDFRTGKREKTVWRSLLFRKRATPKNPTRSQARLDVTAIGSLFIDEGAAVLARGELPALPSASNTGLTTAAEARWLSPVYGRRVFRFESHSKKGLRKL
jgi:hypothetical protein